MSNDTSIDKGPFVVCKAAAGSGKTFTLVLEYLKLAMAGPRERLGQRFRGILAITFTNKAAGEMKHRIMKELDSMATRGVDPDDDRTMGARLLRELNDSKFNQNSKLSPADLQDMAAELQSAILHHYTDLSVFTIDSFMQRIVRTFAHDMGLPLGFDVEIEKDRMIDEAMEMLMAQVGTDGNDELTQLLLAYADSNMDSDRGYNVEKNIAALAKLLFDEDIERRLDRLSGLTLSDFRSVHGRYTEANRRTVQRLKDLGAEMLALLDGMTDDDCFNKSRGYLNYFRQLSEGKMWKYDGKMNAPSSSVTASLTGGKLTSDKCDIALAEHVESLRPQMEAIFAKVQVFFEKDIVDYNTRCAILANLYATALLGRMHALMKNYSRDNEVLNLSEFNRMINSIVEDEDNPAPYIFERLGNRYRHFLIDEFQDTSIMQWHDLVPLVENGVSQGLESLVVGDAKQAIYRFRQGDVRQFVSLPKVEGMRHHGRTLGMAGNSRLNLLDTNYRTARSVVEFNNGFFSWLARNRYADNQLAQDIYIGRTKDCGLRDEGDEELRQKVDSSLEGHVAVRYIDADEQAWVFEEVVSTIRMLVDERGYSYGDIMVLARDNKGLANLSGYLIANSDIPQTSGESFVLSASDAAMAVVAALRYLNDRRDRVAAAELMQRLANLGVVRSAELASTTGDAQSPNLQTSLEQALAHEGIELKADYLTTLDLYDCCEELVRQLHLDGIDIPYVAKLLDSAAAFSSRHRQQIGDFLEWLDKHKGLSAATSDQLDAVRLLTIHKAKGLEAPVVICMILGEKRDKESGIKMWVDIEAEKGEEGPHMPTAYVQFLKDKPTRFDGQRDKELGLNRVDGLNVLYVAFTRPREQLYIIYQKDNKGYPSMLQEYLSDKLDADGRADFGDTGWRKPQEARGRTEHKGVVPVRRLSFADWTSKVSIASPAEKAVTPLLEDKVRFGIYAHELMSGILYATDVEAAMETFRRSHDISDKEADVLMKMAQMAVSHPDASRFFAQGNRVANEVPLMAAGDLGRPDRVVFAANETWVVDFKTGTPVLQNVAQVKGYCRAVAGMGYPAVSGWLLYLRPDGLDVVKAE